MNYNKSSAEESDGSPSSLSSRSDHFCVIQYTQASMRVYVQVKVCICTSPVHLCVPVHLCKSMCLCKPVCLQVNVHKVLWMCMCLCAYVNPCVCVHVQVNALDYSRPMLTSFLHVHENSYAGASQCAWKFSGCVHKTVGKHKSIQTCVSLCVQIQAHKSVCGSHAWKPCASYASLCACASLVHMFASPFECVCKTECMLKSLCVCVSSVMCVKSCVHVHIYALCVYLQDCVCVCVYKSCKSLFTH